MGWKRSFQPICAWYYIYMLFTNSKNKDKKGFTLIEILVVVAIISVLTSVILFSINEARKQSRDKVRKIDLKQLQLALELYKEANGVYPDGCNIGWSGVGLGAGSSYECPVPPGGDYIKGLVPDFLPSLPTDPNPPSGSVDYGYIYSSDGNTYKLLAFGTVESEVVDWGHKFARFPGSDDTYCISALAPVPFENPPGITKNMGGTNSKTYAVYSKGSGCLR